MSFRDDFYSMEATLVNNAKRELANGVEKDPIYKLRLKCFAKGATGILDLAKSLRKMDKDGDNYLSLSEFIEGMNKSGVNCNQDEINSMFKSLSANSDGYLNTSEFLNKLMPPIGRSRMNIINKAFEKIDRNGDGVITVEELNSMYCVRDHPKYLSGDLSEAEIMKQFLSNFDRERNGKMRGKKVTKEEFINYYATISASIEKDAYFDLVMRRAYKL